MDVVTWRKSSRSGLAVVGSPSSFVSAASSMPSSFPALDPCPDEPEEDSGRDDGDRETDQGEAESLKICHVEPPFDRPLRAPASPPRAAPRPPGRGPVELTTLEIGPAYLALPGAYYSAVPCRGAVSGSGRDSGPLRIARRKYREKYRDKVLYNRAR